MTEKENAGEGERQGPGCRKLAVMGRRVERGTPLERKDLPLFPRTYSLYRGVLNFVCYISSSYFKKYSVFFNCKILL